jgi:hypothetical protein
MFSKRILGIILGIKFASILWEFEIQQKDLSIKFRV